MALKVSSPEQRVPLHSLMLFGMAMVLSMALVR